MLWEWVALERAVGRAERTLSELEQVPPPLGGRFG
jgi:hypothetical protein